MTREQALNSAKDLRPSDFTDKQILKWLLDLDGQLMLDYVAQYATKEQLDASFGGMGVEEGISYYDIGVFDWDPEDDSAMWNEMLIGDLQAVPAPYDSLYVDYLVMQIDLHNADYERYNNDALLYAEKLKTWLNRLSRLNWHNLDKYDPETGRKPTVLRF